MDINGGYILVILVNDAIDDMLCFDDRDAHDVHFVFDHIVYAVDRKAGGGARELTKDEMRQHSAALIKSMEKELTSWITHKAGKAVRVRDFVKNTGLQPIPWRWVITWKQTEEGWVIKCRLVLKGFAEKNQKDMYTFSPTALQNQSDTSWIQTIVTMLSAQGNLSI